MDPLIVAVIGLVLMSLLMLLGMPIAFTMLAAGLLGNAYLLSVPAATHLAATNVWEQFSSYGLSVIPLFVLMGQFAYRAGTTERLYGPPTPGSGACPAAWPAPRWPPAPASRRSAARIRRPRRPWAPSPCRKCAATATIRRCPAAPSPSAARSAW